YEIYYSNIEKFHTMQQVQEGFVPSAQRHGEHLLASKSRMDIYKALIGHKKMFCDVGAGTGAFVEAALIEGWQGIGYDLCVGISPYIHLVTRGSYRDVQGTYDVITLHDVLEHTTDPADVLCALKDNLNPDGVLVI